MKFILILLFLNLYHLNVNSFDSTKTNILLEELDINNIGNNKEICFRNMNINEIFKLIQNKLSVNNQVYRKEVFVRKDTQNKFLTKLIQTDNDINLNVGDNLHCEVIKNEQNMIKQKDSFKVYTYQMSGAPIIHYTYFPVVSTFTCFSFKVRASKNVYVSISSSPDKASPILEIILGTWSPTKSLIRKNLDRFMNEVLTPGIINADEYRGFWISWENGNINVGRENEFEPFLNYKETEEMFPVNFVGISTWFVGGSWLIEDPKCPGLKQNFGVQTVQTQCWILPNENQQISMLSKYIEMQKYYLKTINQDYENFKKLQLNENKDFVHICELELKEIYKNSKDLHSKLIVEQLNENLIESDRKNIEKYFDNEVFDQIRSIFFEYYVHLQKSLRSPANEVENTFINENQIKIMEKLQQKDLLKYEYFKAAKNQCFNFILKAGSNSDFHVVLSIQENHSIPNLDIHILKIDEIRSKCIIEKDNSDNLFEIETPNNLFKSNEFINFWLTWLNGKIRFGLGNDTEPFLSWQYEKNKLFDVKYIGIGAILRGHNGAEWAVNDENCPLDLDIRLND